MTKPGFCWATPVLCVANVSRSLEHYRDVLGFEIAWAWSADEAFREPAHPTFACVCRGEISLFLCEQGQGNPGSWVCLNLKDAKELDQLYREYQDSGANIAEVPVDCSWGMREMLVKDLDGNTFRMGCPIEDCSE